MTKFSARALMASSAAVASMLVGGCATVTRGTTTEVTFQSEPPGAAMETSHGFRCTTPCTLELRRADRFVATFAMPGYTDQEVEVESRVSTGGGAAMAGNIIIGGVIGGVIDATSGAMNDLLPNPVIAYLTPVGATPTAPVAAAPAAEAATVAPAGE